MGELLGADRAEDLTVRVLVTGAAGSIGTRRLRRAAPTAATTCVGLDRAAEPEGSRPLVHRRLPDPDAVEAVFAELAHAGGVDAVVHLAGYPDEADAARRSSSRTW